MLTFKTEAEADVHMDSRQHVRELESESGYDIIRKKWAETIFGVSVPSREEERSPACLDRRSSSNIEERPPKGWALKTTKRPSRMTDHVKAYLEQKFDTGSVSGLKADPTQVSHEMKFVKDKNGNLLFSPEEWRTAQQISSFFSRLSAIQRQRQTERGQLGEPRDEIPEEDLEALESEIVFNDLRQEVLRDMTMPHHPIEVGTRNVCELSRANKLQTLMLSELKEICESLQLAVVGSPARKKSFIEPLETYVKTCTCFQT